MLSIGWSHQELHTQIDVLELVSSTTDTVRGFRCAIYRQGRIKYYRHRYRLYKCYLLQTQIDVLKVLSSTTATYRVLEVLSIGWSHQVLQTQIEVLEVLSIGWSHQVLQTQIEVLEVLYIG